METAQLKLFSNSSRYEQWEKRFIINNLDKSNREIGQHLARSEAGVRNFLYKQQIYRTDEQIMQIRSRMNYEGENNPNWKGGISKEHYRYKRTQAERYPERVRARNKVHGAIRTGKLERQPCEICGDPKSEGHHYKGYENALDVQWLCRLHHRELENQLTKTKRN